MKHIAVVEDEALMREELADMLRRAGYAVTEVTDFADVTGQLLALAPDLVLLDLNLPEVSGFQICRDLKRRSALPVLVLTSRDQLRDEVHALELGADEYLTKPYRKERLLARIGNVLKRYEGRPNLLEGADFLLDRQTYTLYIHNQSVVLPPNQGKLLETLLAHGGQTATKDELSRALWGTTEFIDENALQVNLTRLKKTMASLGMCQQLVSVRGVGYRRMKRNGSYLRQYLPWLGLLLGVDALAALLLWLADARAIAAMSAVIVLATVFLFGGVCAVLCARSKKRERAFTAFLTAPDAAHEQALCRLLSENETQSVHLLGETLRAQQQAIAQLQAQMDDYENYVELWAHEVKTPLALLTLVLDNRRDTLPETVGFKLDYVRNRMQAFIDQMLYYARLRGARRDYRFERLTLRGCIGEVLDDYRPLLEEKGFRVEIRPTDETVFADRRGLCFLLGQVVSNSVKYALEKPVLSFSLESKDTATVLSIRDNGPGVRACDLPYVFEKGFTGDSGHEKNKATGMGLYLAREVAKDLGLTLTAASDWGAGFEVRVTFPVVEE